MSTGTTDRFAAAKSVADAVLYEGYVLYPYRASSAKNQVRWQFGVLSPRAFSEADGSERWRVRTECLVAAGAAPVLTVRVRCLQVQHRAVEAAAGGEDGFAPTATLELDGRVYVGWDEAVDQVVDLGPLLVSPVVATESVERFTLAPWTGTELIRSGDGSVVGRVVRRREQVEGRVRVFASPAGRGRPLVKVAVCVENASEWSDAGAPRDAVVARSLVAVHTMVAVDDGLFVSLLDPPDDAREAAAGCRNEGAFPVLVGADDVVLSSPIILYDHPDVAPESPGDLYDATEIDEILALRVLTLTEEEKAEARGTDPRAAAIIDRCDAMPPEVWERLHGAVRVLRPAGAPARDGPARDGPARDGPGRDGPGRDEPGRDEPGRDEPGRQVPWWDPAADASVDPWSDSVLVGGVELRKGSAVRLRPSRRSDAQDLFIDGLSATVAGVFKDVDGSEQVAVTVDDDPAAGELSWQGRYLFFYPDEVEPVEGGQVAS